MFGATADRGHKAMRFLLKPDGERPEGSLTITLVVARAALLPEAAM
jgi:hypothetical protein